MNHRIIPAIMSGGAGTRLWPVSTDERPKQFHALGGEQSLFAETLSRLAGVAGDIAFAAPIVLCGEGHAAFIDEALQGSPATLVIEPAARNTAAVAVAAALVARELDADALVLLAPADHVVGDGPAFHAALARAAPFAHKRIVTFGIDPDRPATGYGYIKSGAELGPGVFDVQAFKEKPDAETASRYVRDGGYSWNSGMFLFHPAALLAEFDAAPAARETTQRALQDARREANRIYLGGAYAQAPALPLDIAVMEKTTRAAVAPCNIGWADIGSWDEIWRLSPQDAQGNALRGPAVAVDAKNNLIRSEGVRVCAAGVQDLVIIATADAVIVLPRERAQDVKALKALAEKL
ncbi:MAG: sugar phosphate nucleotidyltransferase [Hyphomonadaceae bacterium]